MKHLLLSVSIVLALTLTLVAQTKDDFKTDNSTTANKGLFDKSRLTIHNSVSFGMVGGSGISNLQSQSLYTTMLKYQFVAPVTVKLNFGLPIHSTMSSAQNLSTKNVQSLEYFKSMPMDFQLTWKPTDKTQFIFSVVKNSYTSDYYGYNFFNRYSPLYRSANDD